MRALMTAALLAAAPGVAAAAPDASVIVPITTFVDAFNKGDVKAALATYASGTILIIDEPAPFHWVGPGAPAAWMADLAKSDALAGRTDGHVALGTPIRNDVVGGGAYAVVPALYTFKVHGKAMAEDGTLTFALTGKTGAWKMTGWSWSSPPPHPAK